MANRNQLVLGVEGFVGFGLSQGWGIGCDCRPAETLVETRQSREGQETELSNLQAKLAELHEPRLGQPKWPTFTGR